MESVARDVADMFYIAHHIWLNDLQTLETVEEKETNLISQFIKFYFTSSMLNIFAEHTTNVVITIEKSQAPGDGCINVRNMLSIEEVK